MRVGIVGGGLIARVHGPLIVSQAGAELVGIADPDEARARELAGRLGAAATYPSAEDLLRDARPHVVHVLTPPADHARTTILALEHGCHVLVEKPMALDAGDCRRMLAAAERSGTRLCVNHNMVVQDVVRRALALVAAGALGEVLSVEGRYAYDARRNPALLEEGAELSQWVYGLNGGPLQDHFPHPASLLVELLPDLQDVHWIARNRGVAPRPWDDELRAVIASSGPLATLSLSLSEQPDSIALAVMGRRGTLRADLFNGTLTLQTKGDLPRAVARGLSGFSLSRQFLAGSVANVVDFARQRVDKTNGVGRVIEGFYGALRTGGELPISSERAVRVVELMNRLWPAPPAGAAEARTLPRPAPRRAAPEVLVTGASGFIGTHLVRRLLAEGTAVRALVRPNSPHRGRLLRLDVEIADGDLGDAASLHAAARGVRTIYHAGATLGNDPDENRRTTVGGTRSLVEEALEGGVERLVHLSTLAVYDLGRARRGDLIGEEWPQLDESADMGGYARAKIEAERIVLGAHRERGLGAVVLRPGVVLGPLGSPFFPHLGFRSGDALFLPGGDLRRILPLTYVENTVEGILRAARAEAAPGRAYNLLDEGAVTLGEYLRTFLEETGTSGRIVRLPYAVPWLLGAALEVAGSLGLVRPNVTSRAQTRWKHLPVRFDNRRARRELDLREVVPLREGLRRTFRWYASARGAA